MTAIDSMELDGVHMGKCQSFSNNFYTSSLSRKISIGITVEAPAKTRTEARKEGKAASPTMEKKVASSQGKCVQADKDTGLKSVLTEKQAEGPDQETAAWFSTQPLYQETALTNTFQFYANRTSIIQSSDGLHKKFDGVTYGRKTEKGGNVERVEEFTFATAQEMCVSDKVAEGEKLETIAKGNEALRMKLWEIFGTTPSKNDQNLTTQTLKADVKNSKSGKWGDCKDEFVKPGQNSDSIEIDSESPNQNALRPFTHSLTRKKAPPKTQWKLQHEINKGVNAVLPSSCFKLKCPEKNIFAFDEAEGRVGSLHWTANGSSSFFRRKKCEKRSARIQAPRICLPRKPFCKKSLQSPAREKTPSPPEKTAPKVDTEVHFHRPPSQNQNNKYSLQPKNLFLEEFHDSKITMKTAPQEDLNSPQSPKNANLEKKFDNSPVPKNADPLEDFNSPSPKNTDTQEKFGSSTLNNYTDRHDGFDHPTFAMNAPMENRIPSPPLPRSPTTEEVFCSSAPSKSRIATEVFCNIRTFQHSRWGFVGSDMQTESSDDTREFKGSLTKESTPFIEKKDARRSSSLSSMEVQIPESSEGDELADKGFRREKWPSTTGSHEKPPFMLRRSKRLCSQEDTKLSELSPTSSSSKEFFVTEEINGFQGASENGLGRAIAQFALVLERYKTKMKLQTTKKSSAILASVADRIHLQLQGVVSQIQTDVGKFINLSKSKRKRLELRFQEKQERLKLIHGEFKEAVNKHLEECRNALEELEAYHLEIKGNAEREKASHRKLLVQVEEAIEMQLCDAEKSITAIHKAARMKMQGLKHALEECLSEGLFS